MKRRLQQVLENGKLVWRITDKADAVKTSCPSCENLRLANKKLQDAPSETARKKQKKASSAPQGVL